MRRSLGTGVLDWVKDERQSGRWGSVTLLDAPDGDKSVLLQPAGLVGLTGKLIAVVKEVRSSWTRNEYTRVGAPRVGEEVVLGRGAFFVEGNSVGLAPIFPKDENWLSRKNLFKVHNLTVELYFACR